MIITDYDTAINILKTIAQASLKSACGEPDSIQEAGPELRAAITATFGNSPETPVSEGELARAALDLLTHDPAFAEPISVMASRASTTGLPQRYLDPTGITLTTAALFVLQTRIKFKRDQTGKWSIEVDKKSAGDSAVKLLVERLLSFLKR